MFWACLFSSPFLFLFFFFQIRRVEKREWNEGRGRARGHCAHVSMRPVYIGQTHVFVYPQNESSGCVTIPASEADSLRCRVMPSTAYAGTAALQTRSC